MTTKNKANELYITRIYDAPINLVWEAWTDPARAALWWGPRGFTITTHSKDLKPGGAWNYTMHGPDGIDYPNITKYLEVEKHKRLVYDHGGNETQPPMFRVTVDFSETQGKTKMEMIMALPTPEAATETRKFIKKAGGDATWDRLAEYLSKEISGKEQFVINRSFDAPVDLMYKMWTDPQHLSKWLSSPGSSMNFIRSEMKTGRGTFYCMTGANDSKMYGSTHYLELTPPGRVVYTQQFRDENEKVIRHPMAPTWPETMLTVVELTSENANQTRVTITWEIHGNASREELQTFIQARPGMTQGWTASLDKLEHYLVSVNPNKSM